jgi:hypothetical protein
MTDRLAIGGNSPPAIDAFSMALDDAYATAKDFLDGQPIENQGQADAIGLIVSEVKKLRKDVDEARKAEKRPHDDAAKAVQAKWSPLLERADTITEAAQRPLTTFLAKLAAQQVEAERAAREVADRLAQEAIAASRQANSMDDLERVKDLQKIADRAAKDAKRAGNAKAHVAGMDRAIGLRSYKVATVTDRRAALNWIVRHDPDAITAFIEDYAHRHAATRPMDGVDVALERRVA